MRFQFRFRLRTLLFAAVVLALPLRWCGWHRECDCQFENRIAAVEGLGGQVTFDSADERPSISELVWRILGGDERRGRPAYAILAGDQRLNDDNLATLDLASFPGLAGIDLDQCRIGDCGIANLTGLADLKELSLAGTKISDESLRVVARLVRLETLDLTRTNVTDAGLRKLKSLKRLEVLSVRDSKVTKAGIAELRAALPETLINHNAKR
jgi:hypothetical protein